MQISSMPLRVPPSSDSPKVSSSSESPLPLPQKEYISDKNLISTSNVKMGTVIPGQSDRSLYLFMIGHSVSNIEKLRAQEEINKITNKNIHFLLKEQLSPCDAKDIVQEAWGKALASIGLYRAESTIEKWFTGIVCNIRKHFFRRVLRRRGDYASSSDNSFDEIDEPHQTGNSPEKNAITHELLLSLLAKLDEKKRTAYILFTYEGYSAEDISEMEGLPVSTVKGRIGGARKDLRGMIALHRRREQSE